MNGTNETEPTKSSPFKLNKSHLVRMEKSYHFLNKMPIGIYAVIQFVLLGFLKVPFTVFGIFALFMGVGYALGTKATHVKLFAEEAKYDDDAFEEIK